MKQEASAFWVIKHVAGGSLTQSSLHLLVYGKSKHLLISRPGLNSLFKSDQDLNRLHSQLLVHEGTHLLTQSYTVHTCKKNERKREWCNLPVH